MLRADPQRYHSLKPEFRVSRDRLSSFQKGLFASLAVCAAVVACAVFVRQVNQRSRDADGQVANAELEQLAVDTVAWAERVAKRRNAERRLESRLLSRLEGDRASMRRILTALSEFGRHNDSDAAEDASDLSS